VTAGLILAGCASGPAPKAGAEAVTAPVPAPVTAPVTAPATAAAQIQGAPFIKDIETLSSDDFEGRSVGTAGEARTVEYLTSRFRQIGLAPGNPDGSYVQAVPMSGYRSQPKATIDFGTSRMVLEFPKDFVASSYRREPEVRIRGSELVFVGYGVKAPEYDWDDFKGADLKGKTLVVLINDPQIPDPTDPSKLDPAMFKGSAMTYYGRWTYKYETAVALGAAAVLIVHETATAAYPYSVVVNSWSRENFDLHRDGPNPNFPTVAAWINVDRAKEMFASAGLDFAQMKRAALRHDFAPVALHATIDFTVDNAWRDIASQNVVGMIEGSDPQLKHQYVLYTAHWDHFGWDPSLPGSKHDQIFHGALDNASGVAALLEIAAAFKALPVAPRRSIVFIATTAEERGLLGAQFYATHPLYPLRDTLADINIDGVNLWGRTRDIVIVGMGNSDLDDVLTAAARAQGRTVVGDPEPEKGHFYRADHFEFAKVGVPALYTDTGTDYIGKPADYGRQRRDEYTSERYHKVTDVVRPEWDTAGAVEDLVLLFDVGYVVAQQPRFPQWKPGTEFKAKRDAMLQEAR
jgi:Zn-dependent M28 family amino/carboxypeptidase